MQRSSLVFLLLAAATATTVIACGDDDVSSPVTPENDAAVNPENDAATPDKDASTVDAADAAPEPPKFLAEADYADLVTIAAAFPYGVTQRHEANADVAGSHWGRHGGPIVTTGTYGSGATPKVIEWTIPTDPKAAATSVDKAFAIATGLPTTFFYGADGMVDLPFGPYSLLSYTGTGSPFTGEALLYSGGYDKVVSRGKVNGFYSGVGVASGTTSFLAYTGLSPVTAAAANTNDNGFYTAPLCAAEIVATGACATSKKLFGWSGASGPVVTDAHGGVFVGASVTGGATSDTIYALTTAQVIANTALTAPVVADVDSGGSASIAALAPAGAAPGYVVGIGYAPDAAIYAAPYLEQSGAIAKAGAVTTGAITRATGVDGLSVFSDPDGDLWLAVTKGTTGTYLELRRKTQ